jgi:hypothetical protein
MSKTRIPEELSKLIVRYVEAAKTHGQATDTTNPKKANTAAEILIATYQELRRRGQEAQKALLPLLTHENISVRGWAGTHALEFAPLEGERALAEIADIPGSLASFDARMTLQLWRAGKLEIP